MRTKHLLVDLHEYIMAFTSKDLGYLTNVVQWVQELMIRDKLSSRDNSVPITQYPTKATPAAESSPEDSTPKKTAAPAAESPREDFTPEKTATPAAETLRGDLIPKKTATPAAETPREDLTPKKAAAPAAETPREDLTPKKAAAPAAETPREDLIPNQTVTPAETQREDPVRKEATQKPTDTDHTPFATMMNNLATKLKLFEEDLPHFRGMLENVIEDCELSETNVEEVTKLLNEVIMETIEQYCPRDKWTDSPWRRWWWNRECRQRRSDYKRALRQHRCGQYPRRTTVPMLHHTKAEMLSAFDSAKLAAWPSFCKAIDKALSDNLQWRRITMREETRCHEANSRERDDCPH